MQLCVFIKINDSVRAQNRIEKKKYNATNCDDLIRRFSLPHTNTYTETVSHIKQMQKIVR